MSCFHYQFFFVFLYAIRLHWYVNNLPSTFTSFCIPLLFYGTVKVNTAALGCSYVTVLEQSKERRVMLDSIAFSTGLVQVAKANWE